MSKIKLGDMSYADKKEYQYYKRALQDLYIYGPRFFKKMAEDEVAKIENKYAGSELNAES